MKEKRISEQEIEERIDLIADYVAELSAAAGGMFYEDIFKRIREYLEPD